MAIRDLQIRHTTVGKIRLGISPQAAGTKNPGKLETFRLTSPAEHLINEAAHLYGGTPRLWQPQGGGARQFEVITETNRIPVQVPRQNIDPWYELWGGGLRQRRCDGVTDTVERVACVCDPDSRSCKPTTRINVGLSDVPGLGVWLLESHGWNAAAELSGLTGMLQMVPEGIRLPGLLVLESRTQKKIGVVRGQQKVITLDFRVPVIHFDAITMRALTAGGDAIAQALGQSNSRPALQASTEQDSRQILRTRLLQQIADCNNADALNAIGREARKAGIEDQAFADTWRARAAKLNAPVSGGARRNPQQAAEQAPTVGQWKEAAVAGEEVHLPDEQGTWGDQDGPDANEQYNLILMLAAEKGWNTDQTNDLIRQHCSVNHPADATGHQLRGFYQAAKAGQIT